eukprot:TRINITY_DN6456_c2_g1_i1.p1 TRINITY_DN6456_c2_g1~~TRINITY_DN6456_c2_g1_i1.p1  ORF type:complete len:184 (+),score=23.21 TRINITY_DN6456_c2_g1_i1:69-620(+)
MFAFRSLISFALCAIAAGEIVVVGSNPDAVMKHVGNMEAGSVLNIGCDNEGGCAVTISQYHCVPHTLGVDGGLGVELAKVGFEQSCSHTIKKDDVLYPTRSLQRELLGKEVLKITLSKFLRHAVIETVPLTSTCNLMEHPTHCFRNPRCTWSDDFQLCNLKVRQCSAGQPSCLSLSKDQLAFL